MKRFLFLTLCFWGCLVSVVKAENYPYHSDVLWVTVPDHADWLYEVGENATVNIQFYQYGIPQDGLTINYELADDLMPADTQGTVRLKNGKATIPFGTMKKPGFRDCRLRINLDGTEYRHHIKVGFSPEKLKPHTQKPADFEAFWKKNLEEASRFPLQYAKERYEKLCTDKVDCYLIKLQLNPQGQAVYGYLFYPKNALPGSCPVVFSPPGAGVKTIVKPQRHLYYAEEGCIRLEIEIHGLHPDLPASCFKDIAKAFDGKNNGYLCIGLDNRDHYYMKRVYLACVRCIDLLTSLPEWNGKNVIVQGGSQGGALALVTAGLDSRVTACVANYPALSDMAGSQAGRADGYPHFSRMPGMTISEKLETMAYYDVVNFAPLIKAPTYMTWGYNDDTCPPTTSYIVYNTLTCPKEALLTPVNEHWSSDRTEYKLWLWIKKQLRK